MLPNLTRVIFTFVLLLSISITVFTQTPTSTDVMRDRISKAKAHLVVKNYSAAIYELENIRRETNDRTIHRALNVLLMHAYLEQGDYKRTQKFLNELFSSKKPGAAADYIAVAGQVVSGAKTQFRRYEVLGLDVSDEKLPSYAVEDLDQMRKTLELIIEQSKAIGKTTGLAANSHALLEETSSARAKISRDDYDTRRWENEIKYARQQIASSGSRIINAVDDGPINAPDTNLVSTNLASETVKTEDNTPVAEIAKTEDKNPVPDSSAPNAQEEKPSVLLPVEVNKEVEAEKIPEKTVAKSEPRVKTKPLNDSPKPTDRKIRVIGSAQKTVKKPAKSDEPKPKTGKEKTPTVKKEKKSVPKNVAVSTESNDVAPITVGSLIGYATKRVNPVYPRQARTMRTTGVVKVRLTVDEKGNVAKVDEMEGPTLLKRAARDAVAKWRFTPFTRDGQPVKATGFVSFNFNL